MTFTRRYLGVVIALLLAIGTAAPVFADTTASTGVTVTIHDAGALAISFGTVEDGYTFRNADGSTALSVTAVSGDIATATIRITWTDTRDDETRMPFSITLQADDLGSTTNAPGSDQPFVLSAAQLGIVQIGDLPLVVSSSLDSARTVYSSPAEPVAGEQTLDLVIQLVVPPSTFALTYNTILRIQVATGDGGP